MRFLLLIKWVFVTLFTAAGLVLSMPLFLVFMWSNRHDTQSYLKHMGGELHYDLREDFKRRRPGPSSPAEDRHGLVALVAALLILTVCIYWGVNS